MTTMVAMAEYAPEALKWLGAAIVKTIPSAEFSGIVGDVSHTYGYHRARSVLPSSDYSVQTAPDKRGPADAASALDIKFNAKWMKIVTSRLMTAAKARDQRLSAVREFFGTIDGSTVAGWDVYYGRSATSDDSHLWHVHLSILREYADSKAHAASILSVILGEDDMELTDQVKVSKWILERWPEDVGADGSISVGMALGSGYGHARSAKEYAREVDAKVDKLTSEVKSLHAKIDRLLTDQRGKS